MIQWKLGHAAEALGNLSTLADRLTMRDGFSQGIGRARRRPGRRWHVGAIAMTLPCRSTRKSSTQRCRAGVNGPRFAAIVNDFPDRPAIQDKRQKNALHMKVVDAKDMPGIGCDNHFRV